MFKSRRIAAADLVHLERIEALVRSHFSLDPDALVLVSEDDSRLAGGPERMTTILFWTDQDQRNKVRVFKPAADVQATDMPAPWLRGALLDDTGAYCC